jgi:hypothetical protein
VRLWNVAAGKELSTIELGPVDPLQSRATVGWALAFSSDGRVLATSQSAESYELRLSSSNHAVRFWEVATGKEISKLDGMRVPCRFLAFAPDGRDFAHGHGEAVARARGVAQSVVARDISAGVSMGLLVGGKAEPVCLGSGRELAPLAGHLGAVTCLAFSPDGKSVATGSADQTILTWDRGRFTPAKETPASQLSAKELDALWAELADSDAARAYRAIGRMTASPDETTAFLKRGLQPAVAADPRRVRQLIGELDDQRFAVRQKATEELEQIGDLADPEVRRAVVEGKSLEHRRRLEQLLGKYDWFSLTPEHLRRQRALTILERLGTAEARRVLTDLAEGAAAARQTQAARSALQRLGRRGID